MAAYQSNYDKKKSLMWKLIHSF